MTRAVRLGYLSLYDLLYPGLQELVLFLQLLDLGHQKLDFLLIVHLRLLHALNDFVFLVYLREGLLVDDRLLYLEELLLKDLVSQLQKPVFVGHQLQFSLLVQQLLLHLFQNQILKPCLVVEKAALLSVPRVSYSLLCPRTEESASSILLDVFLLQSFRERIMGGVWAKGDFPLDFVSGNGFLVAFFIPVGKFSLLEVR